MSHRSKHPDTLSRRQQNRGTRWRIGRVQCDGFLFAREQIYVILFSIGRMPQSYITLFKVNGMRCTSLLVFWSKIVMPSPEFTERHVQNTTNLREHRSLSRRCSPDTIHMPPCVNSSGLESKTSGGRAAVPSASLTTPIQSYPVSIVSTYHVFCQVPSTSQSIARRLGIGSVMNWVPTAGSRMTLI